MARTKIRLIGMKAGVLTTANQIGDMVYAANRSGRTVEARWNGADQSVEFLVVVPITARMKRAVAAGKP